MTVSRGRPDQRPARRVLSATALLVAIALTALPAAAAPQDDEVETSLIKPLASRSLLLDGATAGGLMMAVGERGHVLVSRDQGESWSQVAVPTRSTLTAVHLHDESLGWVVGHDAVILRTTDGGDSWERQHWAPELEQPLFDIWFKDAENGFAIGAYGFFLETADGGESWNERAIVDEDDSYETDPYAFTSAADLHLNQISRADSGTLYIAAEAGGAFRSDDDGVTWTALEPPYEGSFFGSLPVDGEAVLFFGLAGTLLVSEDGGESFTLVPQADRQGLATALPTDDGGLILIGEFGVNRLAATALAP